VLKTRGFEGGLGAAVTFFTVLALLQPAYDPHPFSFQLFFRLRIPTLGGGRMWNMRMARPMTSRPSA
jgi:hypothetical protein